MNRNGKYRFFTCARNYNYVNTYAFDTEALLISGNGAYVGYIHYYKGKFNAYQRTYVLYNFKHNIFYIKLFLEKFLRKRILFEKKDGNTPYIVLSTLFNMPIKLPDSKTESKLVDLFNLINKKLKLETEKAKQLSNIKKGLMQDLFV